MDKKGAAFPASIYEIFEIPGLGPKRIKQVYEALGIGGLSHVQYGVGIARKGWLAPEHVINCWSAEEPLAWRK